MTTLPRVSVQLLSRDGPKSLESCLASLESQTYPANRFEIVLIADGSLDGLSEFIRQRDSRARIIASAGSRGHGSAYNQAIRGSESEFVALLHHETRVDSSWLAELVSAAQRHGAVAAASRILNWSGQTAEFGPGGLSFTGHAHAVQVPPTGVPPEQRLLFARGVSALFRRDVFLEAGGFDEDFGACLEDVDLGWRLNLLGHTIVLAPNAVTYRRGSNSSPLARQSRLLERNALAMIYKNYEAGTLERVLPAAIALTLLRGFNGSGIETLTLSMATRPPESVEVTPNLVAHLIALEDFCHQLPALEKKRELIQGRRRRSDDELVNLFGQPLSLHPVSSRYEEIARVLIRDFGIDEIFEPARRVSRRQAAAEDTAPGERSSLLPGGSDSVPKVSIVILTALGPTHLRECLTSLRQQTYPSDRVEVIIVDNGSTVDPTTEAQLSYPGVHVILNSSNLGFAAGNNAGAAIATGDYLVFLNDDTRTHPNWLRELVGTAERRKASAVASRILDWTGQRIDFVEGAVNFQGKGFQLHYDAPAESLTLEEKPLLFACGCAMLVNRQLFFEAGRWDEDAFAYYEDVELGWRLNLLGHDVWFAPAAIVYHKHHGTSGQWPEPPRLRLYERNSLRMLYRLLETTSLQQVLPAALLLAVERALLGSGLDRATDAAAVATAPLTAHRMSDRALSSVKTALRNRGVTRTMTIGQAIRRLGARGVVGVARDVLLPPGAVRSSVRRAPYVLEHEAATAATPEPKSETITIDAAASLAGLYGFLTDLPGVSEQRAIIQRKRCAADQEVVSRFSGYWLNEVPAPNQLEYNAVHATLVQAFGIDRISRPLTKSNRSPDDDRSLSSAKTRALLE